MYFYILRRLMDVARREGPEKLKTNCWFLRHDNAPEHRSILVKNFLAKKNVTTLEHPHTLLTWPQMIFTRSTD